MSINICEIENLYWSEDLLIHLVRYGKKCYDLDISMDQFRKEATLIKNGTPNLLDSKSNSHRIYEIILDAECSLIGTITLNKIRNKVWELDVAMFDKYSQNGYAKKAIQLIIPKLRQEGIDSLEAIVRKKNPFFEKIITLLINLGFMKIEDNIPNVLLSIKLN